MKDYGLRTIIESVGFILSNSRMKPAEIQRDYQWSEQQVSALWEDLSQFVFGDDGDDNGDYFLGMLIFHSEDGYYAVYDGLQRLTTLTILICLLRDQVDDDDLRNKLNKCVLDHEGAPRLQLLGHQYLAEQIQPTGSSHRQRGGFLSGQAETLRRAQGLLRDEVKKLNKEQLVKFSNALLDRVILMPMSVDTKAMANRVFQTINMRGLKLEDADLIKSRLAEFDGTEEEVESLVQQWRDIRQVLTSRSQTRTEQFEDSHRFDRYSGFQGFVLALEMMELMVADTPDNPQEAVDRLDNYIEWMKARHQNANGLSGYFRFLHRCAENWNTMNQPAMGGINSPFRPLLPIRAVWWTEWKPLVLRIMGLSSQRQIPAWRKALFEQIHRSAMAQELADFSPRKRQLVFAKALRELEGPDLPDQLSALKMRDEDVERIYRTLSEPLVNYRLRRALILWTEYMMSAPDYRFYGKVSIEHILPQSTNPPQPWLINFPDPQKRDRAMHQLGNLILLPHEINLIMRDDSFPTKRAVLQQYTDELKAFHLFRWVSDRDDWTEQHIYTRTAELRQKIWSWLEVSDQAYKDHGNARA